MNIEIMAGAVALAVAIFFTGLIIGRRTRVDKKEGESFLKRIFPDNKSLDTTLLMAYTFISIWVLLITDAAGILDGEIVKDVMHLLTTTAIAVVGYTIGKKASDGGNS
jgi:predicted permease